MINIFTYKSPNHSEVGAIDSHDRFEQVFDTYYIPEASEKIFTDDISMVRPQKMYIFDDLKAFISNFAYWEFLFYPGCENTDPPSFLCKKNLPGFLSNVRNIHFHVMSKHRPVK